MKGLTLSVSTLAAYLSPQILVANTVELSFILSSRREPVSQGNSAQELPTIGHHFDLPSSSNHCIRSADLTTEFLGLVKSEDLAILVRIPV